MAANTTPIPDAEEVQIFFRNYSWQNITSDLPILSLALADGIDRLFYRGGSLHKLMADASGETNLADGRIMVTTNSGKANVSSITESALLALIEQAKGFRVIQDGFVDQNNVSFLTETVDVGGGILEGKGTLSTKGLGDLVYFTETNESTLLVNDTLEISMGDVRGESWVFLDGSTLVKTSTYTPGFASVWFGYWNDRIKEFIINITQYHGTNMTESSHEYNHLTRGSRVDLGQHNLELTDFSVSGDGSTTEEYQFERTAGNYHDEDIRYSIPTSGLWGTVFWEDQHLGTSIVERHIPGGVDAWDMFDSYLYNAPSGRPYYNKEISPGVRGLVEVEDGKYFFMMVFCVGGDGIVNNNVSIMGQNQYDSIEEARANASSEVQRVEGDFGTLREIATLGTVLYQASNLFTNSRKAKIIPFSEVSEYKFQPYYDNRYPATMVTNPGSPDPSAGFQILGYWNWARYTIFYGSCANSLDTEPNDWIGATTISIHRNSSNGTNNKTLLDNVPDNSILLFDNDDDEFFEVQLSGPLNASGTDYTATIGSIVSQSVGASFADLELIRISIKEV